MCLVKNLTTQTLFPNLVIKGKVTSHNLTVYRSQSQLFMVKHEIEKLYQEGIKEYNHVVSKKQRRKVNSEALKKVNEQDLSDQNDVIDVFEMKSLIEVLESENPLLNDVVLDLKEINCVDMSLTNCINWKDGDFGSGWLSEDWIRISLAFGNFLNRVLLDLADGASSVPDSLEALIDVESLYSILPPVLKVFLDASTSNVNYSDENKTDRRSKAAAAFIKARKKNFICGEQLQDALVNYSVARSRVSAELFGNQGAGGSRERSRLLLTDVKPPVKKPLTLSKNGFDNSQIANKGASNLYGQNKNYMSIAAVDVSVTISKSPDLVFNEALFPERWLLGELRAPSPELLLKLKNRKRVDTDIVMKSIIKEVDQEIQRCQEPSNTTQSSESSLDPTQSSESSLDPTQSSESSLDPTQMSQSSKGPTQATVSSLNPSQGSNVNPTQCSESSQRKVFDSPSQSQHSLTGSQNVKEDTDDGLSNSFECEDMDCASRLTFACSAGDVAAVRELISTCDNLSPRELDEAIGAACLGSNSEVVRELCLAGACTESHLLYAHEMDEDCVVKRFTYQYIPSKRNESDSEKLDYFDIPEPGKRRFLNPNSKRGAFYNHIPSNFTNTDPADISVHDIMGSNPNSKARCAAIVRVIMERRGYYVRPRLMFIECDGLPLSLLLDVQLNTYKCVCGKSFYGIELFKAHLEEQHPEMRNADLKEFLEFKHIVFIGGMGHYYMNSMKSFTELIWNVMLQEFVETLNWETRNQLTLLHRVGDTHLGYQMLLCSLYRALLRKLVEDFITWANLQTPQHLVDGEQFLEWIQQEDRDPHQRFEINTFLTLHGMVIFLGGLRRNNFEYFFAGLSCINMLWFIRNHPIYRQLDLYLSILREVSPFYVYVVLFVHLSHSWTGEPTSGEHLDFIIECVNKEVKAILPKGEVSLKQWNDACRSVEALSKIKKTVYDRYNMENLLPNDTIHDEHFVEDQIEKLVTKLREIHHRNSSSLTYPKTLSNFRNVGLEARINAINDLKNGGIINSRERKTEYVPNSCEEEKYLLSVDSLTLSALNDEIIRTILQIDCDVERQMFTERYRKFRSLPGGKRLDSLKSYLLKIREELKVTEPLLNLLTGEELDN